MNEDLKLLRKADSKTDDQRKMLKNVAVKRF